MFFPANAAGGIVWAGGTALIVYYVGRAAEKWLSDFSWVALAVAVLAGLGTTLFIRHRTRRGHSTISNEATTTESEQTPAASKR